LDLTQVGRDPCPTLPSPKPPVGIHIRTVAWWMGPGKALVWALSQGKTGQAVCCNTYLSMFLFSGGRGGGRQRRCGCECGGAGRSKVKAVCIILLNPNN
jgi:hypothetical protein